MEVKKSVVSEEVEVEVVLDDVFHEIAKSHRLRMSALIFSTDQKKIFANIDVLDSSFHKQDVFSVKALRALGWKVSYKEYGLLIKKPEIQYIARAWPIDEPGRVNRDTRERL